MYVYLSYIIKDTSRILYVFFFIFCKPWLLQFYLIVKQSIFFHRRNNIVLHNKAIAQIYRKVCICMASWPRPGTGSQASILYDNCAEILVTSWRGRSCSWVQPIWVIFCSSYGTYVHRTRRVCKIHRNRPLKPLFLNFPGS